MSARSPRLRVGVSAVAVLAFTVAGCSGAASDGAPPGDDGGPTGSCASTRLLEGRANTGIPAGVALLLAVDDCNGNPVTGLSASEFSISEDSYGVSVEGGRILLPKNGVQVFASLVLDFSSSISANKLSVLDAAKGFVSKLHVERAIPALISIQVFGGEAALNEWQAPTSDTQKLLDRLDALAAYSPADPSSTNLNGAVAAALSRLDAARADFVAKNYGGAFTGGHVVLFTDGRDTAGRVSADSAIAAVEQSSSGVLVVGLRSAEYDGTSLEALASDGIAVADAAAQLPAAFARTVDRIAARKSGAYLLGYCSPSRSGNHTVSVSVAGLTSPSSASYTFSAAGFAAGCEGGSFTDACAGKECAGVGCGYCNVANGVCNGSIGTCATILASGQDRPSSIAVDASHVYWTNSGGAVMKAPLAGGAPVTLAPDRGCTTVSCASSLNITPDTAVWADERDGAIWKVPLAGGTPTTLATGLYLGGSASPRVAADSQRAYVVSQYDTTPQLLAFPGGALQTTLPGRTTSPGFSVALDADRVYVLDSAWGQTNLAGSVWSVSRTVAVGAGEGMSRTRLADLGAYTGVQHRAITTNASTVFWASGIFNYTIFSVPKAGGSRTEHGTFSGNVTGMAADASGAVYWADPGSGIIRRRRSSDGVVTVASGHAGPTAITLDANHMYWVNGTGGTIMRSRR